MTMRPNVLLVMIDSLRADRCRGTDRECRTPFLDELRGRSTFFTRAFSTASTTTICTTSILTGAYPVIHGVHSLARHRLRPDLPTLAEAFRTNGYHTWAEMTGPLLPVTGLERGFDKYRHRNYTEWLDTSFGEHLSERMKGDGQHPWFGFLHLWEVHYPRRVTPEYNHPEFGQSLYDRAVSSLDNQLRHLMELLPKDTVLVLTGDHGEYLSESRGGEFVARLKGPTAWLKRRVPGVRKLKRRVMSILFKTMDRLEQRDKDFYRAWLGHGFHIYDPLVHIPLLFYGPGLFPGGVESSHLASHVDIFPTLASALDFQMAGPSIFSGLDLMLVIREPGTHSDGRAIYMEAAGARLTAHPERWLAGLRTEHYKYVRGLFNESLPEELYDLDQDPAERKNLAHQTSEVVSAQRARLLELMQSAPEPHADTEIKYSPEELAQIQQRLRDLGYVE